MSDELPKVPKSLEEVMEESKNLPIEIEEEDSDSTAKDNMEVDVDLELDDKVDEPTFKGGDDSDEMTLEEENDVQKFSMVAEFTGNGETIKGLEAGFKELFIDMGLQITTIQIEEKVGD